MANVLKLRESFFRDSAYLAVLPCRRQLTPRPEPIALSQFRGGLCFPDDTPPMTRRAPRKRQSLAQARRKAGTAKGADRKKHKSQERKITDEATDRCFFAAVFGTDGLHKTYEVDFEPRLSQTGAEVRP
jgi:hypothetical protein